MMKSKFYSILSRVLLISSSLCFIAFTSCTEDSNGIATIPLPESRIPQDTSFRNPVWEPDLTNLSVIKAPSGYYSFGAEKEFSPGLDFVIPIGKSSNLMNWALQGQAFEEKPAWLGTNKVTDVCAVFNKTLGQYFLFYTIADAIGVAYAINPQGPYSDLGKFLNKSDIGSVKSPYVFYSIASSYLFVTTDDGILGFEISFNSKSLPTLKDKNASFKIAGNNFSSVSIFYKNFKYYLFGITGQEGNRQITMGSSLSAKGPYLDKDGNDLLTGSGTLVLEGNDNVSDPAHVGGVFTDADDLDWIVFNATDEGNKTLSTGVDRYPVFLSLIPLDNTMWPTTIISPKLGWCSPKFGLVQ